MSKRRVRRPPPQNLRDLPLRTLTIESLDSEGRGVAREEGKVVFVERALTGETVAARTIRTGSSFDQAETVSVLKASSGRREPPCEYFRICGGCATQHADQRTEMAAKQRWLEDSLQRIGKVEAGDQLAQGCDQSRDVRRQVHATAHVGHVAGFSLMEADERAARQRQAAHAEAGAVPVAPLLAVDDG
ncbi:MAG: hypothetical protein NT176_14420, partial [Proteobacteria bacterium]|nr:hypothetical protein [Pseudomonadota bacterium]